MLNTLQRPTVRLPETPKRFYRALAFQDQDAGQRLEPCPPPAIEGMGGLPDLLLFVIQRRPTAHLKATEIFPSSAHFLLVEVLQSFLTLHD